VKVSLAERLVPLFSLLSLSSSDGLPQKMAGVKSKSLILTCPPAIAVSSASAGSWSQLMKEMVRIPGMIMMVFV
jgi:hypothetical protein